VWDKQRNRHPEPESLFDDSIKVRQLVGVRLSDLVTRSKHGIELITQLLLDFRMVHKLSNSPLNRPQCCLNCWSTKQSIRTSKLRPIKFERLIVLRKKKITEPQNTKFECRYECVCVDIPTNKVGWTDKYHQPTTTIYSLECENSTRPLKSLFAEYLAWSRKSCRFFKRVRLFPKAFQGLVLIVR